jgi:two-component sensor histidine kinase
VAEPLEKWDLASMVEATQLLASELVTNAIRYAEGPVTLRLIKERTLVCEVIDNSSALPRLRHAARDDESGRGLQIVSRLSSRWGARRTATGKAVWCEQAFPRGSEHDD